MIRLHVHCATIALVLVLRCTRCLQVPKVRQEQLDTPEVLVLAVVGVQVEYPATWEQPEILVQLVHQVL